MASKEEELKELAELNRLAELEELAQLNELAAKEQQAVSETPADESVLENIYRKLNFVGGLGRGSIAGGLEPLLGKDIVSAKEVGAGTVPGIYDLSKRADFDLLNLTPGVVRNLAKLTGQEELVRKGVGMVGDVYTDPSTYLLPGLQAVRLAKGVSPAVSGLARGFEIGLNPLGEALGLGMAGASKAVTATTPYAKKAAYRLMGLSAEQADQMAKNPELFKVFKDAFLGQGDAIQTQKVARESLKGLVDDLKKVGLAEDEALRLSLEGTNVDVDLKQLRKSLKQISDPLARMKAANLLAEARRYKQATRPFQPEFMTGKSTQMGVEGLTTPSKIIPSEAVVTKELPDQELLLQTDQVLKPDYTSIPQPPKAPDVTLLESQKLVAPTEEDLINYYKWKEAYDSMAERAKNPRTYRYNKDVSDMPVPPSEELLQTQIVNKTPEEELADLQKFMAAEQAVKSYEAKFPQLKQVKEPELMLPPSPQVEKIPATITPAYSDYFPPEVTPFSTMLQEPLQFPQQSGLPANLVRNFRQLLQKEAKYSMQGTPAKRQLAEQADLLNIPLREIQGLQSKEAAMGRGKDLQKWIRTMAMSKKPITSLGEGAKNIDIRAMLEEAAQRASTLPKKPGKAAFLDVKNTMDAARKAAQIEQEKSALTVADLFRSGVGGYVGQQYGGNTGLALGTLAGLATSPKTASAALPVINRIEQMATSMPIPVEKIPPQLWMELLRPQSEEPIR